MRKLLQSNQLLLLLYGCLVVCLASYFIIRDLRVIEQLQHRVPYLFLVRFSLFWFVSLLLAVTIYLAQLSSQQLQLTELDKVRAQWAGYATIALGMAGCAGVGLLLYLYRQYPAYFYL